MADLEFIYDASGNRIVKIVKHRDASGNIKAQNEWTYTYYVRDASGNIMSTYSLKNGLLTWEEAHIYGSSRIGLYLPNKLLNPNEECAVNFDVNLMYSMNPGDGPFEDEINNAINAAGLSIVFGSVHPIIRTQIEFARLESLSIAEFQTYMQGMLEFLCLFSKYTIEDDNSFNSIILPQLTDLLNESTHLPKTDINDIGSINMFWQSTIASMTQTLQNTYYNATVAAQQGIIVRNLGSKHYELSNHLGNVLVTVTDKKIPVPDMAFSVIEYFNAEITNISDYYPFGMLIKERAYSSDSYRFGFNGMEKDNEKDDYFTLFRKYDSRICRWFSVDPKSNSMASLSSYMAMNGSPISSSDPLGDKVPLLGRKDNKKEFISLLNDATGGRYKIDRKGNLKAKFGNYGKSVNGEIYKSLITSSNITPYHIVKDDDAVFFDSYLSTKVDVGDISKGNNIFRAGILAHVGKERLEAGERYSNEHLRWADMHERYFGGIKLSPKFAQFHLKAIESEVKAINEKLGRNDLVFRNEELNISTENKVIQTFKGVHFKYTDINEKTQMEFEIIFKPKTIYTFTNLNKEILKPIISIK